MALTEEEKEVPKTDDVSRISVESSDSGSKPEKMKDSKEQKDSKFLKIKNSKKVTDKNDPFRFEGEGVIIKAKLIGVDDVHSARGDKMCQDYMQMLKAVVKASGEHKQRINLSISFQGVKIKDEKSGEVLYTHPVHLISFIAQDINDSRAFGYIYGSPQGGHKFIAIKTDKAASHAVITLRDLFEVVLAMKNSNPKMSKDLGPLKDDDTEDRLSASTESSENKIQEPSKGDILAINEEKEDDNIYSDIGPEESDKNKSTPTILSSAITPPLPLGISKNSALIDLLDLELDFESSVQPPKPVTPITGTSNGTNTTPDPFGTPFTFPAFQTTSSQISTSTNNDNVAKPSTTAWEPFDTSPMSATAPEKPVEGATSSPAVIDTSEDNRYAWFSEIDKIPSVFENPLFAQPPPELPPRPQPAETVGEVQLESTQPPSSPVSPSPPPKPPRSFNVDIFSELDPLGKDNPVVDKSLFFSELKSPRKKSLKDLGGDVGGDTLAQSAAASSFTTNVSNLFDANSDRFENNSTNADFGTKPLTIENDPWNAFPSAVTISSVPKPVPYDAINSQASPSPKHNEVPQLLLPNPFNPFQSDLEEEPPLPKTPPPPPPRPIPHLPANAAFPLLPMRPPPSHNGSAVPTPPPPRRKPQQSPCFNNRRDSDSESGEMLANFEGTRSSVISPPIPIPPRINGLESPGSVKSSNATNSIGSESPVSFGNNSANASPRREHSNTTARSGNFGLTLFEKNSFSGHSISSGYESAPASSSSRSSDSPNPFSPLLTPPPNHSQSKIPNGQSEKNCLPPPLPPPNPRPSFHQTHNQSVCEKIVADSVLSKSVSVDVNHANTTYSDTNDQSWKSDPFAPSKNFTKLNGITPFHAATTTFEILSPLSPEERSIFRKNSDPFDDEFFNANLKTVCNGNNNKSESSQVNSESGLTS